MSVEEVVDAEVPESSAGHTLVNVPKESYMHAGGITPTSVNLERPRGDFGGVLYKTGGVPGKLVYLQLRPFSLSSSTTLPEQVQTFPSRPTM